MVCIRYGLQSVMVKPKCDGCFLYTCILCRKAMPSAMVWYAKVRWCGCITFVTSSYYDVIRNVFQKLIPPNIQKCQFAPTKILSWMKWSEGRREMTPGGPLPILLGTDVPLRFLKHPPFIYSIFLKIIPILIYFRWKSWRNHIFHNSVINMINVGDKFTTHLYNGTQNYLPIDITDWWK
jgi:hypothetical protein